MLNIQLNEAMINDLVQKKVDEILSTYKRQVATVDIKDLVEITGLSKATLIQKIVYEPEIVAVTRRVGTRVLYLYPQVLEAYQTLINRIINHMSNSQLFKNETERADCMKKILNDQLKIKLENEKVIQIKDLKGVR